MRLRARAVVLAAALAVGCGGGRKESRAGDGERAAEGARTSVHAPPGEGNRGRAGETAHGHGTGQGEGQGNGARANPPRVAASPEALLGRDTVTRLQQALAQRGLLKEHQRGELDVPTSTAVRRFQEQQGLAATGVPDKETLRKLGVDAEEAYGSSGSGKG